MRELRYLFWFCVVVTLSCSLVLMYCPVVAVKSVCFGNTMNTAAAFTMLYFWRKQWN